jgi:hypothetical protein
MNENKRTTPHVLIDQSFPRPPIRHRSHFRSNLEFNKMANRQRVSVQRDELPHISMATIIKIMIDAGDIAYFETMASTGINMHPATRRQLRAVDASIGGMRWEFPSSDDPEDEDIPAPAAGKASSAKKRRVGPRNHSIKGRF